MKNNKFLNFIKKFPVIISTIIVAPALIYTGRYLLTDEYYFSPFEMEKDSFFEDYGLEFYIPRFSSEITAR